MNSNQYPVLLNTHTYSLYLADPLLSKRSRTLTVLHIRFFRPLFDTYLSAHCLIFTPNLPHPADNGSGQDAGYVPVGTIQGFVR